jgi:hypothetical protein
MDNVINKNKTASNALAKLNDVILNGNKDEKDRALRLRLAIAGMKKEGDDIVALDRPAIRDAWEKTLDLYSPDAISARRTKEYNTISSHFKNIQDLSGTSDDTRRKALVLAIERNNGIEREEKDKLEGQVFKDFNTGYKAAIESHSDLSGEYNKYATELGVSASQSASDLLMENATKLVSKLLTWLNTH